MALNEIFADFALDLVAIRHRLGIDGEKLRRLAALAGGVVKPEAYYCYAPCSCDLLGSCHVLDSCDLPGYCHMQDSCRLLDSCHLQGRCQLPQNGYLQDRLPFDSADADWREGLVFCLITLGPGIDETVGELFDKKNSADGYILDYLGSEILFSFSREVSQRIETDVQRLGLFLSPSCHPGSGGSSPELQNCTLAEMNSILAEMKKQGEVPVIVNDHGMLIPEKSMLCTFRVSATAMPWGNRQGCESCDRMGCIYRK